MNGICPFARQIKGVTTFSKGNAGRVGFCDHAASGFFGTMLRPSFWHEMGTSVHFAISRDGEIAQLVNIFDTAFAQGRLGPMVSWPPFARMNRENPNGYLISTEHEDWTLVNGKAREVPGSQWTEAEYAADLKLKKWCLDEVRMVTGENLLAFGIDSLASHHMFDGVNRAECAGRYWRNEYRARLYADLTRRGDEIMDVINGTVPALRGRKLTPGTPSPVRLEDFDTNKPFPAGVRRLRIEVYLAPTDPHGIVQIKHSDGHYGFQVGWDGARYGMGEVDVAGGGFSIEGNGVLAQVGVLAVA